VCSRRYKLPVVQKATGGINPERAVRDFCERPLFKNSMTQFDSLLPGL